VATISPHKSAGVQRLVRFPVNKRQQPKSLIQHRPRL